MSLCTTKLCILKVGVMRVECLWLGEFTAKILEYNVRENIGSFIFTKGKT